MKQENCEERVERNLNDKLEVFRMYLESPDMDEPTDEDYPPFYEYGLSFDYVEPNTFEDQPEGYLRYQLSWGGPSDEFRFYVNLDGSLHRIEYWFLDWFDGAHRELEGEDYDTMEQVFDWITGGDPLAFVGEL